MKMMFRRAIGALAAIAIAAALLWTPSYAAPVPLANNLGLRTIPFRIVNNTGHAGDLFLYVIGEVASNGKSYYLSNVNGDVTIVPQLLQPTSLGLNLGAQTTYDVMLPQLRATRIFFSFDRGLVVTATAEGAPPSAPPGWVQTDPNFNTLFDFAEFTWLDDVQPSNFTSTLGINATQVDMFGFAMLIALTGTDDAGTVGAVKKAGFNDSAARKKIFSALQSAGKPWRTLIMGDGRTVPLRVIAPYHGIEMGVFPANFLDDYIDQVWTFYTRKQLSAMSENRTYAGTIQDGLMVFNEVGGPDPPFKFDKPTSKAAFENAMPVRGCVVNNPPAWCGRAGAIGALMGAGFMRTTLLAATNLNKCAVKSFYQNAPVNMYAETFHQYSLRQLAYSFGFDDTCDQSSFIQIHDPTKLQITIQPFN